MQCIEFMRYLFYNYINCHTQEIVPVSCDRADGVSEEKLWLMLKFRDRIRRMGYNEARECMRHDCDDTSHFKGAPDECLDILAQDVVVLKRVRPRGICFH